ncbi:MAG: hypothetical protein JO108_11990 [Acidobacteriaceae bacterium]|nr:hypothetical protein [Acidobacteriaceae bacterium]
MSNACRFRQLLGVFAAAIMCAEAGGKPKQTNPENTLCVHFYNLAAVPSETAQRATFRVATVFARAGIRTAWEQPPIGSEEAHVLDLNDSVGSFRSNQRPCLVVVMVANLPAGAYHGALGFAVPHARFGIHVELVYRRIELQAQRAGVADDVVLAYAMAHEIGHVLLDSSDHSPAGIMRGRADVETWQMASLGRMQFLPEEAKQMRNRLVLQKQLTVRKHETISTRQIGGG